MIFSPCISIKKETCFHGAIITIRTIKKLKLQVCLEPKMLHVPTWQAGFYFILFLSRLSMSYISIKPWHCEDGIFRGPCPYFL